MALRESLGESFYDVEDYSGAYGQPIARTTSAGVHPYATSSAAVNQPLPPSNPSSQVSHNNAAAGAGRAAAAAGGEEIRPEDVPREQSAPKLPLYKRKWFIITSIVAALLGIAILFILLYPVVHAISQHIINVSVLNIDQAQITNPTNSSCVPAFVLCIQELFDLMYSRRYELKMDGWVSHAGIFKASLKFNQPLQVTWVNSSGDHVPLGSFPLDKLYVRNKRAYINQTVPFTIADEDAFGQFAKTMITQPNFTWHLTSEKLDVRALAFPTAHNLHFSKDLTLQGMNSFDGNVKLVDFQLPADDPAGGIKFVATTGLNNPSAFNVNLGTVLFDLSYKGLYLGTGSGVDTVIQPGGNNITLKGTLVRQTGTESLAKTSELFTQYLNGEDSDVVATGRSSVQADGKVISWLSTGLTALQLQVPFKAPGGPISPIKTINIGDMALAFSEQNPWAPVSNSRTVQARMELPFGFNIAIGEISNTFNLTTREGVAADLATVRFCSLASPSSSSARGRGGGRGRRIMGRMLTESLCSLRVRRRARFMS